MAWPPPWTSPCSAGSTSASPTTRCRWPSGSFSLSPAGCRAPRTTTSRPGVYALTRESGDPIVIARGVAGFSAPADPFWLTGCSVTPPTQLGNVELRVLDSSGYPMGAYFIGAATVENTRPHLPALVDVLLHGTVLSPPHPLAEPIWNRWHQAKPGVTGEWRSLPPAAREAWLEAVRLHHRWATRSDTPQGTVIALDSTGIAAPVDFYCALGEAINGPAGYFGSSLDSLADCLRGDFGITAPFTLLWHPPPDTRFQPIVAVLTEAGVQIRA